MRLRVSDPRELPALRAHLTARLSIVAQEDDQTLVVGVLGSHGDGGRRYVQEHLERWRLEHPNVRVLVEPASERLAA